MHRPALALLASVFLTGCFSFNSGPDNPEGGSPGIIPGMQGGLLGSTSSPVCQGNFGKGSPPATLASVTDAWGRPYPIAAPWGTPGNQQIEKNLISTSIPLDKIQMYSPAALGNAPGMARMPMPVPPGGMIAPYGMPPVPGMGPMNPMMAANGNPWPGPGAYPWSNAPTGGTYPLSNYPLNNANAKGVATASAQRNSANSGIQQVQYTQPSGGPTYGPPVNQSYQFGMSGGTPSYGPPAGMGYGPPGAAPYGPPAGMGYGPPGGMQYGAGPGPCPSPYGPCPPGFNPFGGPPSGGPPCMTGPASAPTGPRVQVHFTQPTGMKVSWYAMGPDGQPMYSATPLITPASYNFTPGAVYRLKLTNIEQHSELGPVYPTMEVMPLNSKSEAFLSHTSIPLGFTEEDFKQISEGNYVVKVIYLPDPQFQILAGTGTDEILSTRLEPGIDPIQEARRRGVVLLVIRMGNLQQELTHTPPLNSSAPAMPGGRGPAAGGAGSGGLNSNTMPMCPPPGMPGAGWVPGPQGFNSQPGCGSGYGGGYGNRGYGLQNAQPLVQVPMEGTWANPGPGCGSGSGCNQPYYPPQRGGPNMTYPGGNPGANTGSEVKPPWQGGSWIPGPGAFNSQGGGGQGFQGGQGGGGMPTIKPYYPPGGGGVPSTEPPDPGKKTSGNSTNPWSDGNGYGTSRAPTQPIPPATSRNDQQAVLVLPDRIPPKNNVTTTDPFALPSAPRANPITPAPTTPVLPSSPAPGGLPAAPPGSFAPEQINPDTFDPSPNSATGFSGDPMADDGSFPSAPESTGSGQTPGPSVSTSTGPAQTPNPVPPNSTSPAQPADPTPRNVQAPMPFPEGSVVSRPLNVEVTPSLATAGYSNNNPASTAAPPANTATPKAPTTTAPAANRTAASAPTASEPMEDDPGMPDMPESAVPVIRTPVRTPAPATHRASTAVPNNLVIPPPPPISPPQ